MNSVLEPKKTLEIWLLIIQSQKGHLTTETIYLPFVNICLEQQIVIWFILKKFCHRFIFTIQSDSIINIFYWVFAFLDIINRSLIFIYRWVPTKFSPDLSPNFVGAGTPVILPRPRNTLPTLTKQGIRWGKCILLSYLDLLHDAPQRPDSVLRKVEYSPRFCRTA